MAHARSSTLADALGTARQHNKNKNYNNYNNNYSNKHRRGAHLRGVDRYRPVKCLSWQQWLREAEHTKQLELFSP